jgi:hypothetical protein
LPGSFTDLFEIQIFPNQNFFFIILLLQAKMEEHHDMPMQCAISIVGVIVQTMDGSQSERKSVNVYFPNPEVIDKENQQWLSNIGKEICTHIDQHLPKVFCNPDEDCSLLTLLAVTAESVNPDVSDVPAASLDSSIVPMPALTFVPLAPSISTTKRVSAREVIEKERARLIALGYIVVNNTTSPPSYSVNLNYAPLSCIADDDEEEEMQFDDGPIRKKVKADNGPTSLPIPPSGTHIHISLSSPYQLCFLYCNYR